MIYLLLKETDMLYQFVKPLARWILGLNFKRIYLSGLENIPAEGPVILAANHPTAFIEPCVLASFQKRPLYFLVRGDFFRKKVFSFFLGVLHMIPIYRMKDGGFAKIKNNFSSFDRCFDALDEGKVLMILAEGFCIHEKRLRPIRKGTARIAFGTIDKYKTSQLAIVPVGVNYSNSDRYRSDLMIDFGQPIMIADYLEKYKKDEPEAIRQLTQDIEQGLRQRVIHIERDEDIALVEGVFEQNRLEQFPVFEDALHFSNTRLQREMGIANKINGFDEARRSEVQNGLKRIAELQKQSGAGKWAFAQLPFSRPINLILIFFTWPLATLGGLWSALPIGLAQLIGGGRGVSIEFRHSIKVATGLGAFLLSHLIILFLAIRYSSWILATFFILAPVLVWIFIRYRDLLLLYLNTKKTKTSDLEIIRERKNLLKIFE